MSLDLNALTDPIVSYALASGYFDRVNAHEPKAAPGNGLTVGVWVQSIGPAAGSGLASTSALVVFTVRLYSFMLVEPQDAIDPNLTDAMNALFVAYSSDVDFGGAVRAVDLLGMSGVPMRAVAGYLNVSGKMYRVYDITLPLIVNDVWDQA